jgi:hypothetical protein
MEPSGAPAATAANTAPELSPEQQHLHDMYGTIERTVAAVSPALRTAGSRLAAAFDSTSTSGATNVGPTAMVLVEAVHQLQPLVVQVASAFAASRILLQALNTQDPGIDLTKINDTLLQLLKDVSVETHTHVTRW